MGCSPYTAPSRPLPSASAFLTGIRRSLCLGGSPAAQELESPCSWLTQHPPWPRVPLSPGMNSSPASWGVGRKVGCCTLKHHVGWAGLCWAGLALPAGTPPLLTSEVLGQVWTWRVSMMRPWKCGGFLPVTQGHVWRAQGLPRQVASVSLCPCSCLSAAGRFARTGSQQRGPLGTGLLVFTSSLASPPGTVPCPDATSESSSARNPSQILSSGNSQPCRGSKLL